MLVGLLFAVRDADDTPGALAATLPFAGVTLIEYQARLLTHAGAAQIVIVVARLTPELLGAVARIQRRGVVVDVVRIAAEVSAKIHPLARVVMFADGLVTTAAAIARLTAEGGDALLTVEGQGAPVSFERLGGNVAWAGVARLSPQRIAEVAAMPRDYDVQSTLVRVAAQSQAPHVPLDPGLMHAGHGIEYSSAALAQRGQAILAATVSARRGWFDRWVVAPIARGVLPSVMARGVATIGLGAAAGGIGLLGLGAIATGYPATGSIAALAATIAAAVLATLAWTRDEAAIEHGLGLGALAIPALAVLLLGHAIASTSNDTGPLTVAIVLVTAAALAERAAREPSRRRWWGSPPAYLSIVMIFVVAGYPVMGLAIAATYATATLAAAIETLRRDV